MEKKNKGKKKQLRFTGQIKGWKQRMNVKDMTEDEFLRTIETLKRRIGND